MYLDIRLSLRSILCTTSFEILFLLLRWRSSPRTVELSYIRAMTLSIIFEKQ